MLALKLLLEQAVKMRDGLQRVSKVGKVHAFEKKKRKKRKIKMRDGLQRGSTVGKVLALEIKDKV